MVNWNKNKQNKNGVRQKDETKYKVIVSWNNEVELRYKGKRVNHKT